MRFRSAHASSDDVRRYESAAIIGDEDGVGSRGAFGDARAHPLLDG